MITGLVEGIGLLAIFGYGLLKTGLGTAVSIEIIWISTFLNLGIFLAVGISFIVAGKAFPRLPLLRIAVFVFAFLLCFDWLAVPLLTAKLRLSMYAVAILAAGLAATFYSWYGKHAATAHTFWRRSLKWVAAVTVLTFVFIEGAIWLKQRTQLTSLPPAPEGAPNIVVVVVDTLRADHLSLYGYGRRTSPNLDSIASRSLIFDNAISTCSWTTPSHASMLTGLLPHENGTIASVPLGRQYHTVGEALQALGYRTAAFSGNSANFSRRWGLGRGFIYFDDYFYSLGDMFVRTLWGRVANLHIYRLIHTWEFPERQRAAEINRRAFQWMEADRSKPFFVFLNYFDVHAPYLPPQPYRSRFSRIPNPGGILAEEHYVQLTAEQQQSELDAYDGAVAYIDDEIAKLFRGLQQRGFDKDTLVIITSDHGESLGDHGLEMHENALYRELIHVPLIIWWPGKIPAGRHITVPVSTASIPATLLDLVSRRAPSGLFPQPSLAKLWEDPASAEEWPYPISELGKDSNLPASYPAHSGDLESLYGPQWQIIRSETLAPELYNWVEDPHELENRAGWPASHQLVTDFTSQLQQRV